jgi:hypothetical protein
VFDTSLLVYAHVGYSFDVRRAPNCIFRVG